MTDNTLTARKTEMRAKLKQIRAAIPAESRKTSSQAIFNNILSLHEVTNAKTVFIYISYGNEVDTHSLLKYFLDEGKTLAVPKILPAKTMIAVPFTSWEELTPGELGILTPVSDQPFTGNFDVVITPGLGFTQQGHRIGYGRGYYDKWFAQNRHSLRIATAYEPTVLDEIPANENDIRVNMIVTEKRIIKCREKNKL